MPGATPAPRGSGAAGYPERPVRLVVPYAVGGATDVIGCARRALSGEELGQPGGGEQVWRRRQHGSLYAKQPADGYTLVVMVESSHAEPQRLTQAGL